MPGPKYGEFKFPSSFGFTGSATDRSTIPVKSYERAKPKFAQGGAVKDPAKAPAPKTPPPRDTGKASLVDIMKGKTRKQQEQELGLKKGGKVLKKATGGSVKSPGHALQQRSDPTNDVDQESGGRTGVRPGFKRGGVKKAMGGPVTAAKGGMKKVKGC